ncbi:IclR family transcriptional regulator, partial [Pseudomonas aeruginosa]
AQLTSHMLPNVTGQAATVFDAQQEIVCAMTTVTDLGQLQSAEERDALFHEALQVTPSTGGPVLPPG